MSPVFMNIFVRNLLKKSRFVVLMFYDVFSAKIWCFLKFTDRLVQGGRECESDPGSRRKTYQLNSISR